MAYRKDAFGLFWQTLPPKSKDKKIVLKRSAPDPVWLRDSYLPHLEEARSFNYDLMSDTEIINASQNKENLILDIETYRNYFLAVFRSLETGKSIVFEETLNRDIWYDAPKMLWILQNFTTLGFNSLNFDMPLVNLSLDGVTCDLIKKQADNIIIQGMRGFEVLKAHKVTPIRCDHIDLIEVAPLFASLKVYGGRLHVPRMQDLPFHPSTELSPDQMLITKWYCFNDTTNTAFLYECLKEQILLRCRMSAEHKVDLRSKSDAQIAEAIIGSEWRRLTGRRPQKQNIPQGTTYRYYAPAFLNFQTDFMRQALHRIQSSQFVVNEEGKIETPEPMQDMTVTINKTTYKVGVGGLHSQEKKQIAHTDETYQLIDMDFSSFYPKIILTLGMYPQNLGPMFLNIYESIVIRRLDAKAKGHKEIAESLKITINGTYGKLSNPYSLVYSPDIGFHTTITGQLVELMATELFELNGIQVISGNTDGLLVKCPRVLLPLMKDIVKHLENVVGAEIETTNYKSIYARDVNNYIAIKENGTTKLKGAYANPWNDPKIPYEVRLHKNPQNTICIEAVIEYLTKDVPLIETISNSKDVRKFVSVRKVKGGAVKDGDYLGESIRWYYANGEVSEIVRAVNGHKVPKSEGAKPMMVLSETFPEDINYDWYLKECQKILVAIGYIM